MTGDKAYFPRKHHFDFGELRLWRTADGILWAENDLFRGAYLATDDATKIGALGWHNEICVEFISEQVAKGWQK
jgi:hypothetical protein